MLQPFGHEAGDDGGAVGVEVASIVVALREIRIFPRRKALEQLGSSLLAQRFVKLAAGRLEVAQGDALFNR